LSHSRSQSRPEPFPEPQAALVTRRTVESVDEIRKCECDHGDAIEEHFPVVLLIIHESG